MKSRMAVTVTVTIDVPEDASLETCEYAAYEAAKRDLAANDADWYAVDVDDPYDKGAAE